MTYLLDTSALIWWLEGSGRMGGTARAVIEDRVNTVFVSAVSWWEIALKLRSGKLAIEVDRARRECDQAGFVALPLTFSHARRLIDLVAHHKDPFDHILIAQAMVEGATVLTGDRLFARYPIDVIAL